MREYTYAGEFRKGVRVMNTILYGFQLAPGADDEFVFAGSFADCQAQAVEHRAEIRQQEPETYADMGAMAVYRFEFRSPTVADFISVLNERDSLLRACVVDRQLVGLVVD